jgi:hypothetical protein
MSQRPSLAELARNAIVQPGESFADVQRRIYAAARRASQGAAEGSLPPDMQPPPGVVAGSGEHLADLIRREQQAKAPQGNASPPQQSTSGQQAATDMRSLTQAIQRARGCSLEEAQRVAYVAMARIRASRSR